MSLPNIASTEAYERLYVRQDEEGGFRVSELTIIPLTLDQLGDRVQKAYGKVSAKEYEIQVARVGLSSLVQNDPNIATVTNNIAYMERSLENLEAS